MKKIVSLLAAFLIAISGSICAFAASSPGGEVKPDQFNVVGTVTKGEEKLADIVIKIGNKNATTDKKGAYRIEGIEAGKHTAILTNGETELGTVSFNIAKGTETKYEKLNDNSYNITVAANIATILIDFNVNENGTIEITKVAPAGNDSPVSPPLGDIMSTIATLILLVSFAGIMVSVFFKKKYSC